nr:hypothetical protein [uncultured bacterium]
MPTLSKDQVRQIIQNAPSGTSPGGVIAALRQKGYQLEGYDQPSSKDPGFLQRVKSDISKRQENINEISKNHSQSELSTNFQIIGQGFGAGADTFAEAGKSIYKTVFPEFLRNLASKIGQRVVSEVSNATIAGEGTPKVSELVSKGAEKYNEFKQEHPELAGNIEAAGNIVRAAGEVYGAGKSVDLALQAGKAGVQTGKQVINSFENKAAQNELDDVLQLTRATLNKQEKKAALTAGQGQQKGLLKTIDIQPSARDIEVAEAARTVVNPSKSAVQNISAINKEITASSQDVIKALERNNSIFNTRQLRTYVSSAAESAERQILLAGDEAAQKAYRGVVNTFMSVVAKHPKTLKGLLAARKEFDRIAEAGLKGVFSEGVISARKQAIRDIRRRANEYIAEQLPAGDALKEVLLRQSLLFEARDNIADKTVEKVGTNIVTRAASTIKKHPVVSTVAGAAAGTAAVGSFINK